MAIVSSFDAVTRDAQSPICSPTQEEIDLAKQACDELTRKSRPRFYHYSFGILLIILGLCFLFPSPIHGIVFIFAGIAGVYGVRYQFMKDVAKLRVAQARGWTYDPASRGSKGDALAIKWGMTWGRMRSVQDQLWTPTIYAGEFQHTVGSGKSSHTDTFSFIGVPAKLPVEFLLRPQQWQIFEGDKELHLESEQFNKTFEFVYTGTRAEMAQQITQILTPSMQVELCDLVKSLGELSIAFRRDSIFFISKRLLYKPSLGSVINMDVTESDVRAIEADLEVCVQFAERISGQMRV